VALTRRIEGWHRGGADFDYALCEQAVNDFLLKRSHIQFDAEQILKRMKVGRDLKFRAEIAKVQLSGQTQASLTCSPFLDGESLLYKITKDDFEELIRDDLVAAESRLHRALHETGVSPKLLARLFLSGGTCNIPCVRERLAADFGDRIVSRLEVPAHLRHASDGIDDIGNATAMGAALLAVHGAEPVFSSAVGVRLADAGGDHFHPIFRPGEALRFTPKVEKFFISDASSGVARLLICEQDDSVRQPGGRLLRVVPVPVDRKENWLKVTFTLDRHLVLKVEAEGVKARARTDEPAWIQHLNLGFRLPPREPAKNGEPSLSAARSTGTVLKKGGRP
jgi:Hsp70 protein